MEAAVLGLVLDSSVLIAAERKRLTTPQAIRNVRESAVGRTNSVAKFKGADSD